MSVSLEDQSPLSFAKETAEILNNTGVDYSLDEEKYSKGKAEDYWSALKQVYFILLQFRGGIIEETSNVNFWPNDFDLAMLWFSGRLIPGQDPSNWDYSREQMNFGFFLRTAPLSELNLKDSKETLIT